MLQNLKSREFYDPLDKLYWDCRFKFTDRPEKNNFHSHYTKYKRKLEHLFIILDRIIDSHSKAVEKFKESQRMIDRLKKRRQGEEVSPIEENKNKSRQHKNAFKELKLDVEDFYIHARILMDYVTHLTVFYFENKPIIKTNYTSFNKHKKWLKNTNPNHIPNDYISYITNKTSWFDKILKVARDKYITHDLHPRTLLIKISKDNKVSLVYGFLSLTEEQKKKIKKIESKYAEKIIPLKDLSKMNIYDIVDFFNNHPEIESSLDEKDQDFIYNIKIKGGEFPDVDKIMDNILEFLKFYNNFFRGHLS